MADRCFVNSIVQVSCQPPLSDTWFDSPCIYEERYVRALEPDTKGLISPSEARRMSRILKRAVYTSLTALNDAETDMPDAVITGTGMGCMENSENFLVDLCRYGEQCLKPTLFMQSTHNTISSLIAIILKCHGYNNTYSHKGISFESSLLDAWVQLKNGMLRNALVGAHDEVTPFMSLAMKKTHPEYSMVSEASVSAVVTSEKSEKNICEITDVKILYRPEYTEIANLLNPGDDEILLLGVNGNALNDAHYTKVLETVTYSPLTLQYKNIFGDNFSAPALGFYAAVKILEKQRMPSAMMLKDRRKTDTDDIRGITILNHSDGSAWSLIRIRRI